MEKHPDQPEWLSHVNAGILKVNLAMALIGIFDPPAEDIHQCAKLRGSSRDVATRYPRHFCSFPP